MSDFKLVGNLFHLKCTYHLPSLERGLVELIYWGVHKVPVILVCICSSTTCENTLREVDFKLESVVINK